jgi:hypothetical protein
MGGGDNVTTSLTKDRCSLFMVTDVITQLRPGGDMPAAREAAPHASHVTRFDRFESNPSTPRD